MQKSMFLTVASVMFAGTASAQWGSLQVVERLFNDYPDSELTVTTDFPNSFTIDERNFGSGGFANRHMGFLSSDGGATAADFDYDTNFDICVTMNFDADPTTGREAGIMTDLFGFGFFGALGNGEIAAFGSFLPFHTFGTVYTNNTDVTLRMIYTPGAGQGMLPASTIEYIIDQGSGPVTSGPIVFTNNEGGIPSGFGAKIGVGIQSQGNPGGYSDVAFTDFKFVVPAPGTGALALGGMLIAARRRRA